VALSGQRVLVTGATGQIGLPLACFLALENEVWAAARFTDTEARRRLEEHGVQAAPCDLAAGSLEELPSDFDYVVHLAAFQGTSPDYDHAIRVNGEGTGRLLAHCRQAKGVLVMSTHSVYAPHPDPLHVYAETDPLGDAHAPHSPSYSVSKLAEEAVARYCARAFGVPVTIARMNASYGPNGGLPAYHLDAVVAGQPVVTRWDPCTYSPIHQDDINSQVGALLAAASVPASVLNWAGDEPVSVQQWCAYAGELSGREPRIVVSDVPGASRGSIADTSRRAALTGLCRVDWREGLRQTYQARHSAPSP